MSRPKNKEELLVLSQMNFDKLNALLDKIPTSRINEEFPDTHLYRNIRDVIAHLHHWNTMVLDWYETGERGEKPMIPAEGYSWKTLPELNKVIWENYLNFELDEVRILFSQSYEKIKLIILSLSNEQLFEKKRYSWTGTTSLGAYFISSTSSHYDWAIKKIKKSFKV